MAQQNLVSATLTAEAKAEIIAKLASIKETLDFTLSLQPDEIRSLFKAGNTFRPFINKAFDAACVHAEILPRVFDIDEFKRDYELAEALTPILQQVNELAEGISNTMIALQSDLMAASLEVYAAAKQHRDKVPGLNIATDEMGVFFKKSIVKRPVAAS